MLGLGLAAAVGLNPGPNVAGYTVGVGALMLAFGLLLPDDPGLERSGASGPSRR